MAKVTIRPSGESFEIKPGQTLLECLREQGVYIKSSCGGVASCSDCIVKIAAGEDYLTPPPFEEIQLMGNVFHITKERMSCQVQVEGGDVTIDISAHNKSKDEQRLLNKTTSFSKKNIKVKKKSELAEQKAQEEELARQQQAGDEPQQDPKVKEKEGGMKRPRPFKTED